MFSNISAAVIVVIGRMNIMRPYAGSGSCYLLLDIHNHFMAVYVNRHLNQS